MNGVYGAETLSGTWGHGAFTAANRSDTDSEGGDNDVDEGPLANAEVTALCWSDASVGVARYLCAECRIEVFEAPVYVVAGEAVRCRNTKRFSANTSSCAFRLHGGGGGGGDGEVRILVHEDVPPSLLWLVRYLEVHQPQVLLPHAGSDALNDVVNLVCAHQPLEVIRLSSSSAFKAEEALPRLTAMYPGQKAELANRFHTENKAMMRAMAALLQFVAAGQANVADVVERGVLHALYLEDACAEALQITRTERHPSSAQGQGRAKEGLSLRGLLSATQSSLGKAMLRQWIALPCCDLAEIEARQSVVAFFVQVEHQAIAAQLRTALYHVRSTSHIFTTMRSGRALRKHYVSLYRTISGIIQVQRLLSTIAHEVSRFYVLLQSIEVEPLLEMVEALSRTIVGVNVPRIALQNRVSETLPVPATVFSEGYGNGPVSVHDGVDAVLDELRLRLHELRLSLQSKAEIAFEELPWELRTRLSLRCVYVVPHGYLLCVPAADLIAVARDYVPADLPRVPKEKENDDRASVSEDESDGNADPITAAGSSTYCPTAIHTTTDEISTSIATTREHVCQFMLDAFQWRFHHETQSGECCFKSAAMEELDTWVGDLQRRVQQREQQVRRQLDTSLLHSSLHLLRPTRALGELDCLLSFGRVSAQEGWCRPEMVVPESGGLSPNRKEEVEETVPEDTTDDVYREEDGVLEIENGWHPLLSRQLGLQQLVPFSLHLRTSTDRVCVVLGVNSSGKSVLINAVAHIVFLAHVGCHVPAATARMSLINGIFAPSSFRASSLSAASTYRRGHYRMGDMKDVDGIPSPEVEAAQSSFYSECVALHRVLHHVAGQQRMAAGKRDEKKTKRSAHCVYPTVGRALVLLDEFGRGTAPEDGCALLKGTLRYLATGGRGLYEDGTAHHSRWRRAPLVLCATHLVEMLKTPSHVNGPPDKVAAMVGERDEALSTKQRMNTSLQTMPVFTAQKEDAPLPLEWIKIYDMEALITYAPEDKRPCTTCETDNDADSVKENNYRTEVKVSASRCLPLDVTPTYHPVCVTPHTGHRRWEDWQRHSSAHLDAGPALGRQCGLDPELLACWESALRVLHGSL